MWILFLLLLVSASSINSTEVSVDNFRSEIIT